MALRIFGFLGALLIIGAAFAPAVTISFEGTKSVFAMHPAVAGLLALAGALTGLFALLGRAKAQLLGMLGALVAGGFAFYATMFEVGMAPSRLEARIDEAAKAAGVEFDRPPVEWIMSRPQLEWSWYLLALGLVVSLVTALIAMRAKRA